MALGDNPKVTRKRFNEAFEAGIIHWQLRSTPIGEQWRLHWRRRRHPAFRKRRRVHPAYYGIFVRPYHKLIFRDLYLDRRLSRRKF